MSIVAHTPTGDMWLCYTCGKYFHTMMGDKCDSCCAEERRQKEADRKHAQLVKAIQELTKQQETYRSQLP
jgi:rRNA maturation endonuclease Nob1